MLGMVLLASGSALAATARLDLEPPVGAPLAYVGPIGVYNLYWSSAWGAAERASTDSDTRAIVESDYAAKAAQYGVPGFRWAGSGFALGACPRAGATATTLDVMALLVCEDLLSAIPTPGGTPWDFGTATMIYNVIVPDTTTVQLFPLGQIACSAFAGYHFATPSALRFFPARGAGRPILFTVIPTKCAHPNGLVPIISHELIEAATDPMPTRYWIDESSMPNPAAGRSNIANALALLSKGEAGDICSALFGVVPYAGTKVGAYWSNSDHACVVGTKRVVHSEFHSTGPNGPYRLDLNGVSSAANFKGPLLEGTYYKFSNEYPGTEYQYVYRGDCEGTVTFPTGNVTADASASHSCGAKIQDLIRFDARGIPSGATWQVTVAGVVHNGYTTVFADYGMSVTFAFGEIPGCTLTGTSTPSPYVVTNPTTITATYECAPPPPPASTYPQVILGDSPVAYWRLGDSGSTAHDSGPSGFDGSYEPGVTQGVPGAIRNDPDTAAQFGSGGVVMPDSAGLDIQGYLSVEVWAKGGPQAPYAYLVSKSDWSGTIGYSLYTGPNGTLRFFVGTGSAEITAESGFVWDDQWHHIVGVFFPTDGGSVTLYVDKELIGWGAASGYPISSSLGTPLTLGRFNGGGFPFTGSLDEVAMYDHVLSYDEIHHHYNQGVFGSING